MPEKISPAILVWLLFCMVMVFVFFKVWFVPFKFHIYEEISGGIKRWKGQDFGRVVNKNGVMYVQMMLRKKIGKGVHCQ